MTTQQSRLSQDWCQMLGGVSRGQTIAIISQYMACMHNKCIYGQCIRVQVTLMVPPYMNIHIYRQMINVELLDSCSLVNNDIGVFMITKDIGIEGELQVINYDLYLIKALIFPPAEGYT